MNQSRFEAVHRGLTAQAKKVYDSIPCRDGWNPSQVMQDLRRRNISMSDMHVVMGCINSLIGAGLIAEPERGLFMRTPIREKPTEKQIQQPELIETPKENMMPAPAAKPTRSPVAILSVIASRAKAASDTMRKLADDIETAALEIEENIAAGDADTAKLKQLQQLLKSLS